MKKRTRRKTQTKKIQLSTKPIIPTESIADYNILIHGQPGIGKTSLVNHFGKVHYFFCGDRNVTLPLHQVQCHDWSEFRTATQLFIDGHHSFDTAVVDVAEAAYELCFTHMCDGRIRDAHGNRVSHPADAKDHGKSWKQIKAEFAAGMGPLMAMEKGCIFLSHTRVAERETAEGDTIEDLHPAMSGQCLGYLTGLMDIIGYYHYKRGERQLRIRQNETVMAKCRPTDHFLYTDGTPMEIIPMGSSSQEAHDNFIAAFNNEMERPTEPKRRVKARRKVTKKKN